MQLSYAEMVEALAKMNHVHPPAMGAFRAKLRKLQGEGIPGDVNPGKGKRVNYTLPLLIEATVAVELLQMGWSAPQAAALIRSQRDEIFLACLLAVVPRRPPDKDVFLLISPEALFSPSPVAGGGQPIGAMSFVSRKRLSGGFGPENKNSPLPGGLWGRWG